MKRSGNRSSLYCRHEKQYPSPCSWALQRQRRRVVSRVESGGGRRPADRGHRAVVVVGGGQAGLAMSYCLRELGVDHVVLERHRIGYEWRERRWDSFCLVTPNWQCQLPGFPYRGPEPDGFMVRDDVVRYLEEYAASFDPPVVEGVEVTGLRH